MLTGCIFSTERPDPPLDMPGNYRAGRGQSAPPALDWWRGFRSAELTRLMEDAQTDNLDIGAAIARIIQADAQSKIARAPLLPTIGLDSPSGGFSATKSKQPGAPETERLRGALSASYEIDFWGKNRALSRAAQETAVASRFTKEVVVLTTIAAVGTAYFNVLSSQDRLRIARNNLAAAMSVLKLIQERRDAGTASDLDVAQQESLVASVRAVIPLLDQTLRENIAILAVLVGRAPSDFKVRGGNIYALGIPRVTPGLPSQLLLQRPDIRAAEANLASADANVEAARAAFLPNISLTAVGGYENIALKALFTPQSAFYQLVASLTQPLLDGFRLEGQLELVKGQQLELLRIYCQTILAGFRDVEVALIAIVDTTERERLQRDVVTSSRRAFDLAKQRLDQGVADLVTLLQVQQTLFVAEDQHSLARLARLQAVLSLYQALGGSWLPPGVGANANLVQ
jgi:NodT family efflux transporter outer membrane factor (OMF) lipoprotein